MDPHQIENIYPLTPMQQGMLFHTLYAPESGVYFEQMTCELEGDLDSQAFRQAWQRVVDRHGVLRTAFDWQNMDEPVQVVLRSVELPLEIEDWRGLDGRDRRRRLERFLLEDRERGFDLANAPLLRLHLLRTGERRFRLVWSHHHLLLDGWSMPVLFAEFFAFYHAARRGEEIELAPPRPFADYVAWLRGQDLSRAREVWRRELAGFTSPTPLGLDRPTAPPETPRELFGSGRAVVPAAAGDALAQLAQRRHLTLNTLVQAAWALLLSRHADERDVVFGTVVAGRPPELAGVEEMVGLFLNTLPLRVEIDPQAAFVEWAERLQKHLGELRDLEWTPLVEIQGWSEVPRGQPLFESLYVFENYPVAAGGGRDEDDGDAPPETLELSDYRAHEQTDLPLTLVVKPSTELELELKFDHRRFTDEAVAEILAQLVRLLECIAATPEAPLSGLDLLTEKACAELDHPGEELEQPRYPDVARRFLEVARADSGAPAVLQGERSWTYGELAAAAFGLARDLRRRGLEPGDAVAVTGERSFGFIAALLGVLASGGVLVPIDPKLPETRRRKMLELARVCVLLRVGETAGGDAPGGVTLLDLDTDSGLAQAATPAEPGEEELQEPGPESPAYVFFTSGTTGEPKAVLGSHQGLAHFLTWQRQTFEVGPGERFAQLTAPSFDVLMRDVFVPLTSGAALDLPDPGLEVFSPRLPAWLAERGVTALHSVPSLAQAWLAGASSGPALSALKRVFFAGEPLTSQLVESFRATFETEAEMVNLYGPTETTLAKCFYRVPENPEPGVQPIGSPLPHAQALVMSLDGRRCGFGEPGEIVIRTPFRTFGYLEPERGDVARFAPNPWSADEGDLLYRTGDRGRYRLDGRLEILGRLDEQVKVNGVRVEPAEVAAVLRTYESVQDAAVVVRHEAGSEPRLTAYVVPTPAFSPTVDGRPRRVLPNNLALVDLHKNETDYLYREIFELQAYSRRGIAFDDGAVIFDVGANIGLFQLYAATLSFAPQIYSFEPNPEVFELLRTNAELYSTSARLFNFALGAEAGRAEFTFFEGFSMLSGLRTDAEVEKETIKRYMENQDATGVENVAPLISNADEILEGRFRSRSFEVEVRTLSQVIASEGVDHIDLLKINVEKSELEVLRGVERDDWPKIDQVVLEVDLAENLEPIVELLEANGFEVSVMQDELLSSTALRYVYAARTASGRSLVIDEREGDHVRPLPPLPDPFLSAEELGVHAREHLSETMVPTAYVLLEKLPLNANGKLDREALPLPGTTRSQLRQPYVPPRDVLELRLAQIWEDLLGVRPVGVHDDFFDLGGHSLLVAPLVGRVERELGGELALNHLFQAPTVEGLALVLRQEKPTRSCVVPLQPRGEAPPLFLAHPLGGSPMCYQALAQELGPEQPVYGFDAFHLVGSERLYSSFAEMAADYLRGLRDVQPHGPYRVGGWSFGGLVAYEIARQLADQGEEVELLAILDTEMPRFRKDLPPVDNATVIEELLGPNLDLSGDELRRLDPDAQLEHLIALGQRHHSLPPDYDLESARQVLRIVRRNGELIQDYEPQPYPGPVTLFRADGEGDRSAGDHSAERWKALAGGGFEERSVAGTHRDLVFEPHVATLAEELRTCLERLASPA